MNRLALLLALLLSLLLVGCASSGTRRDPFSPSEYGVAIRWSEFESAWTWVDPIYREAHPLTDLDRERFKLIQVTGYDVKDSHAEPDGSIVQRVEIRVVGKFTQAERTIVDRQHWRYDEASKRWWLTTGLPDFNAP